MNQRQLNIFAAIGLLLLSTLYSIDAAEKWSRQLEATGPGDASSFDWVPVTQPALAPTAESADANLKDRSANARVLTYSQSFPPNPRFGELQKHHNSPLSQQHPFDYPYQFQRFSNAPQALPLRQSAPIAAPLKGSPLKSQEPTSQSFFSFEMPYHGDNNRPTGSSPTLQTGYQIQHTFGGGAHATLFSSPLYNQQPVFPSEFHPTQQKPLQQQLQQKPLHQQNYIEDTLPIKNLFKESKPLATQPPLQSVAPQVFPSNPAQEPGFDINTPSTFQLQSQYQQTAPASGHGAAPAAAAAPQQQEVQLLYVPYDTLYNQQQGQNNQPQNQGLPVNKYNVNPGLPAVNPYQINQFYTPEPLTQQGPNYYGTSTTSRPLTTSSRPANIFENFLSPQYTTPKPKPKAHQPPLAMFLAKNSVRTTQSDVVSMLRNANTIAVIDAPAKQIPEIFVGPAGMPTPEGFVKFDLPYLSQLNQKRDLRDVPFFVAPLSYRTPNGFNKILLPEPHVGSIVVNRARENIAQELTPQFPQAQPQISQPQHAGLVYNLPNQNEIGQYQTTTQRLRPNGQRIKTVSPIKDNFANVLPSLNSENQYEITTQRSTLPPSRGNKFSYFANQDVIQEVTSPKITKQERHKKKRPQNVQIVQPAFTQTITNPYAQFQPAPNQIINDEYFKSQSYKPSSTTSTSTTSTTTTTTSTTEASPTLFNYNTSPQVEFQSAIGQLYHDVNSPPNVEQYVPRFTTRPPPVTTAEEEYRMKQYFRQQDAFRNRPKIVNPTTSPLEQVQYEQTFDPTTTQKSIPSKHRVTVYTPTTTQSSSVDDTLNTLPPQKINDVQSGVEKEIPLNHRPSYIQNEVSEGPVEFDPNPYQLPSELPPLTPNLPGLVNNLQEKNKQIPVEQIVTTTPDYEAEQPTRPSRRPLNRVRKPVISKVTSSVSYSESEYSTRRPSLRTRRPYGSRGSASSTTPASVDNEPTSTTTRRPSAARNPLIRNPNRVRYQPTPEERQTLRLKPKKHHSSSKKTAGKENNEDLEYQRDVLNQNYPVFRPATSRKTSSPTAIPTTYINPTTESSASESQQVYTVTPSNNIESEQGFPAGLLEPMQIAQQYNQFSKDNYGPGYFPNQEDLNPTEPAYRNEISPVYTTVQTTTPTTTTTTTEEPITTTTRRSPFIRRNYPRLRTTTESPATTTQAPEEKPSIRPRLPPRKVVKVRTRTRRPLHPASSTVNPEEEVEQEPKNAYRKVNRYNQDLYDSDTAKRRYKNQFHLDGQESQWSPSVKIASSSNFKPVNPKSRDQYEHKFENEPEIVTADSVSAEKEPDVYEVKVSADLGSQSTGSKASIKAPNLKPEKSFAELLEEVMGKAPEESPLDEDTSNKSIDNSSFFESQKTTVGNRLNRRGKWKKIKIPSSQNNESFETAESQNLGSQLLNSLYVGDKEKVAPDFNSETTTAITPTTEILSTSTLTTTTPKPQATAHEYEVTTAKQNELTTTASTFTMDEFAFDDLRTTTPIPLETTTIDSATRRVDEEDLTSADDLESQPSLFSEVRKQLHDLFAIEENEDQAATAALAAVGKRRQEYTSIKRTKPESTTTTPTEESPSTTLGTAVEDKKEFHKDLMEHAVYATSTSTQVTSETEICYRGRCIRSEDLPKNHKLN
ncbi:flocculation protein FLO11 [Teleopsis dalmanni]|uniref:flocculation protein FLO11 n=1 Tax=Teleopsis dalmanni TaxID=139649 RepID=UPI0018CCDBB3|nr:flocculation protein FLO11 [Teleopsis dalmanni]